MNTNTLPTTILAAELQSRGVTPAQWSTLTNSLYAGARPESVLLVLDYCRARKLDPLKKPCHIVPMSVAVPGTDRREWRDVILPGIYEYRTTAQRTGQYHGQSAPVFGPTITYKGVQAPEWCSLSVYRWHEASGQRIEFPATVRFCEAVGLDKNGNVNSRWTKAPFQMVAKCAEAAALRMGFSDELGGEPTMEEVEGNTWTPSEPAASAAPTGKPAVADPQSTGDGATCTPAQAGLLKRKTEQAGLSYAEVEMAIGVAAIDYIPKARVDEALVWIAANAKT
jgi:phage recombination protein Bet